MLHAVCACGRVRAQWLPAAPPELTEAGVPSISIQSPESLGMSSFPTDLLHLQDGRIVIASPSEIVIGDGVRWELHRRAEEGGEATSGRIIADENSQLYTALRGGVARIHLRDGARWDLERLFNLRPETGSETVVLTNNFWVGKDLYWYGAGGSIVRWQPGQTLKEVARTRVTDLVFPVGQRLFVANWGERILAEVRPDTLTPQPVAAPDLVNATVTAAVPFEAERSLVALFPGGLRLFDGKAFEPFGPADSERMNRFTDLAVIGPGLFAASIDGVGILIFDRQGRIIHLLDRRVDSRFVRVQRMIASEGGVLWVLLNEGVARVRFPSPITRFDESVASGLMYAAPVRWKGRLWLHADGRAEEGVYDEAGRLVNFEDRSPPRGFVFTLNAVGGELLACTENGIYQRVPEGWFQLDAETINARFLLEPDARGRFWYAARGEVGWFERQGEREWKIVRRPWPKLTDSFRALVQGTHIWLELGGSSLARLDCSGAEPSLQLFSSGDGLPEGWVQTFTLGDEVRFLVGGRVFRYAEAEGRFELDNAFMERNPWSVGAIGRPARDSRGRIWYSNLSYGRAIEPLHEGGFRNIVTLPPGITPFGYVMEEGGVVWMGQRGRLLRYDPHVTELSPRKPRAVFTRVEFPSGRPALSAPAGDLGEIAYGENSPTFFFMAPGNDFTAPATFEFRLEGGENRWVSTGITGVATFHRLYEGRYRLHLRALVGGAVQDETSLAFTVLPPWYRHPLAFFAYGLLLLGGAVSIASAMTYLQRREKTRLERLVAERTQAVQQANQRLAQQVAETMAKSTELAVSEERYRALYDNNPAMYFTLGDNGRIRSVNRYGAEHLGYTQEELIDQPVEKIVFPEDHAQLREVSSRCLAAPGRHFSWQLRRLTRDGTIVHAKEMGRAVRRPDGAMVLFVVCEDVSAQVALEDQLRQAQKMEAVGQLAGGVAHDFNNLLTVIQGQAEWVQQYASGEAEKQEGLQHIRNAAEQAAKLTRQLLVFSRRQAMQVEPADLNAMVVRVAKLLERVIGEDITVRTVLAAERAPVLIDTGMIEQVLVNLALNARDAMPKGGQIGIEVATVEIAPERVASRVGCRPGAHVCISFSDTGTGISPEVLPRIFEPFYTTKAAGRGTGLGLATSASIISQHHGWIEVESELFRGTTFRLFLPREQAMPEPTKGTTPPQPAPSATARILLVEDEPAVRNVARRLLEKSGYRVVDATNADEACNIWLREAGAFDVLLTDILMPGSMNGRELAARLVRERPSLAVCIMTGHDPDMLAQKEGQPQLQTPHLFKPFTRESLLAALEKVLSRSET